MVKIPNFFQPVFFRTWLNNTYIARKLHFIGYYGFFNCNGTLIIEGKLPVIKYEKLFLTQVFQNLINNAIKHMETPDGLVTIACQQSASDWVFTVADNGVGIAEKYFERVFEIFQTLKPRDEFESTGVGLSIVKKIITSKGGKIWIEPNEGRGAKFIFTVPV